MTTPPLYQFDIALDLQACGLSLALNDKIWDLVSFDTGAERFQAMHWGRKAAKTGRTCHSLLLNSPILGIIGLITIQDLSNWKEELFRF